MLRRWLVSAVTVALAAGCGAAPTVAVTSPEAEGVRPAAAPSSGELSTTLAGGAVYDSSGVPLDRPGRSAPSAASDERRWEVRSLGPPAPAARLRPHRAGRRDIRLHHARLDNALRLIAESGRLNLVLEGDFPRLVTVDLLAVEPYDALVALAEAHGAQVRWQGNIVIVAAR